MYRSLICSSSDGSEGTQPPPEGQGFLHRRVFGQGPKWIDETGLGPNLGLSGVKLKAAIWIKYWALWARAESNVEPLLQIYAQEWLAGLVEGRFSFANCKIVLGLEDRDTQDIIDFVSQLPDGAEPVEWRELEG